MPVIRLALPARRVDVITSTNEVMTLGWLPPACAGAADETTDVIQVSRSSVVSKALISPRSSYTSGPTKSDHEVIRGHYFQAGAASDEPCSPVRFCHPEPSALMVMMSQAASPLR